MVYNSQAEEIYWCKIAAMALKGLKGERLDCGPPQCSRISHETVLEAAPQREQSERQAVPELLLLK